MPVVLPGGGVAANPGTASQPEISTNAEWTLDVDEICRAAFARIGGEQTVGYELKSARQALQFVFQRIMLRGVNLWTLELEVLALDAGQAVPITLGYDTVDILEAVYRDTTQTTVSDIPTQRIARSDYHHLPDKTTTGFPTLLAIDRQRDAPLLYVWPIPDKAGYQLRYWKVKRIRDIDSFVDNVDAPVRWIPTLVAGVAWYMSLERRAEMTMQDRQELKVKFETEFSEAWGEDRDNVPLRVVADLSAYARP